MVGTLRKANAPGNGSSSWRREVFNRQGFVGASLRNLIEATGLEKGGIYNHFGSKEQLRSRRTTSRCRV